MKLAASIAIALASTAVSAAPQSVPAIDTSNVNAVVGAYNTYYNQPMPALNATGTYVGCVPGTISSAFQDWSITRINFLRAMAGVPGNTTLDSSLNAQEQAAALIQAATGTLNHSPAPTDACYTSAGATGSGQSNLAGGVTDAIPLFMDDGGNTSVGHRRWILHSAKNSFGLGVIPDGLNFPPFTALYVFQSGSAVSVPSGIPWPPRGYVPLQIFPDQYTSTQLWSFGLPNADFSAATVAVTLNGSPLTVTQQALQPGYGDNTLVWQMPTHTTVAGDTYNVSISNVGGVSPTSYSYQVIAFDPANPPVASADLSLTESASPNPAVAGKDVVFTMTVTNNGPAAATNVSVIAAYDQTAQVIWQSPACAPSGSVYTCNVGTLANGASAQFKLVLRKGAAGSTYNNAGLTYTSTDPHTANNSPTLAVTVNASPAANQVFRYRLYSPVTLEHMYTTSLNEYNTLGALAGTWTQEGTVGKVLDNPGSFNAVTATPYYRLYNTTTQWHHWTTDPNEYSTLIPYPNWNAEGVDGFILPTTTAGAEQLYRLTYPPKPGLHHWTIDPVEYSQLITVYGWTGEGGSGFVIQ